MAYYKRIGDNDMTSEFVDGSVLLHTDMNEIETLTKTGINANYEDIQKLQDGTLTVQTAVNATNAVNATTASQLSGATLSKAADEDLQDSDNKVPTSKQVKDYVDNIDIDMDYAEALNKPSINGVTLIGNKTSADLHIDVDVPFYYWNGLNTADNVAMFNEICNKYTNGEKFVLVGKVALENGYTYNGTFYERTIDVVVPISVKDFTEYEDTEHTGHSVFSFMTEPVRTTGGYAIGSVDLIGNAWGEFTGVNLITWSYSEGPAMSGNTINVVNSLPAADYTTVGKVYQYMGTTTATYTNGYFYTCTQTGPETYAWTQLNVQPGGGGGTNPVPDDVIFITSDNSTITEDFTDGEVYTIINEKLYNAISSEDNFRLVFVNTDTQLDILSMSVANEVDSETSRYIIFNIEDGTRDFILEQGENTNECIMTLDFSRTFALSNKENDNVSDRLHYLGYISQYNSSAKALNIENLEPGLYIMINDNNTSSTANQTFYFKFIKDGITYNGSCSLKATNTQGTNNIIVLRMLKRIRTMVVDANNKFNNHILDILFQVINTYNNACVSVGEATFIDKANNNLYQSIGSSAEPMIQFFPDSMKLIYGEQIFFGKKKFDTIPEYNSNLTPTTDNQLVNKKYVDDNAGSSQIDTMPTASVDNLGNIVQYTGTTDSTYTNGYFYECKAQGTDPETYAWEAISVQAGGGGGLTNLSDVANGGLQQTTCTVSNPSLRANSVALGYQTTTNGYAALAEGYGTKALNQAAHAEGMYTIAIGQQSHAEGYGSQASSQTNYIGARGSYSHSEGIRTCAAGQASHAEGYGSPDSHLGAYGDYSHTEGSSCHASATNAHAEGAGCQATGAQAHAEGSDNRAVSANSHVEGRGNIVANLNNTETHIQGRYAIQDLSGDYAHTVGNGTSTTPSNAHTIDWSGNAWFAGNVKVGGTGYGDTNAKKIATEDFVKSSILGGNTFLYLESTVTPNVKGTWTNTAFSIPSGVSVSDLNIISVNIYDTAMSTGYYCFDEQYGAVAVHRIMSDAQNGITVQWEWLMDGTPHTCKVKLILAVNTPAS